VRPNAAAALAQRWSAIHRLLFRKYYVDEVYDAAIVNPALRFSTNILWKRADAGVIDGAVNGMGKAVQGLASI